MESRKALIVDDETTSLKVIVQTLDDAEVSVVLTTTDEDAWIQFQADQDISLVILRGIGKQINGVDLCRRLRSVKSRSELTIMFLLREEELPNGPEALIAGASDLLVDPFEPRELRMRAGIVPPQPVRRVDTPHTDGIHSASDKTEEQTFLPEFDSRTKRLNFGALEHRRKEWDNDPNTRKISLDRIIVCPECEAIPTFRSGCSDCGSARIDQEVMIHHYACAHVGAESEFQGRSGLVCPKCRLTDLVAGSDFEHVKGCLRCSDCAAVFTEATMIGHCLNCQHRFVAADGIVQEVCGYRVGVAPEIAVIPAPNFQTIDTLRSPEIVK